MADPIFSISVQTSKDLAMLAKQLKQIDPVARKALPKRLRAAAEPVKSEANRRKPSSKIRIGVRVQLGSRYGARVRVVATSPKNPPLAGLLEAGNKGDRNPTKFRHPVFGNRDVWRDQPTQPYLAPAGIAKKDAARREIAKVIDDLAAVIHAQ